MPNWNVHHHGVRNCLLAVHSGNNMLKCKTSNLRLGVSLTSVFPVLRKANAEELLQKWGRLGTEWGFAQEEGLVGDIGAPYTWGCEFRSLTPTLKTKCKKKAFVSQHLPIIPALGRERMENPLACWLSSTVQWQISGSRETWLKNWGEVIKERCLWPLHTHAYVHTHTRINEQFHRTPKFLTIFITVTKYFFVYFSLNSWWFLRLSIYIFLSSK